MARNQDLIPDLDGRKIAKDLKTAGVISYLTENDLVEMGSTDSMKVCIQLKP